MDDSTHFTVPSLVTPATERKHVHAVYDAIATQWHHTRGKRGTLWPMATQFIRHLSKGSIVADVGCGDFRLHGMQDRMCLYCSVENTYCIICTLDYFLILILIFTKL